MTDPLPSRLPSPAPSIDAPRPFVERRLRSRRAEDRIAREETRLLARSLDILAADMPADARLAGLLDLLARTVGATRAAVVSDGPQRRVAVAASGPTDEPAAIALATWLDAAAPRSRAERAAAAPATIVVARRADGVGGRRRERATERIPAANRYAALPIPTARGVTLGFTFAHAIDPGTLAERMPPNLARHAAVALSLVTESMSIEREVTELRAAEAERAHFVSTVAHELRTPLTGLKGYLDLILDGHVDEPAIEREFLERGRSIVDSMAALVGDLLELSRLESGSLDLEAEPFSVADALSSVAESLLPIALERRVHLETILPPRMRTAIGDRRRVDQIVTNLAANALKYGADGGLVELVGRFEGPDAIIAVRDEGPGIDPEDRPRIFEQFYRMADHERLTGTGLGLAIARDLARAMDGDLDVASLAGTGSAFVLVLPGPAGAHDPDALAAVLGEAVTFESDRLDALAAVRAAERDHPSPNARRAVGGLGSISTLSAGRRR
jgi:two-component system phosphate regulon sensor histidine kinase PhoR